MQEILQFTGYALAYAFNLYAKHLVKEDSLCLTVVRQEDDILYHTFEGDSIRLQHQAATDMLREIESSSGYDVAVLVFDCYFRQKGQPEKEALMAQVFTLDSYANRRVVYPYTRIKGETIPLEMPILVGEWDESLFTPGSQWAAAGICDYLESHTLKQ